MASATESDATTASAFPKQVLRQSSLGRLGSIIASKAHAIVSPHIDAKQPLPQTPRRTEPPVWKPLNPDQDITTYPEWAELKRLEREEGIH
jgi:hypothetical protein